MLLNYYCLYTMIVLTVIIIAGAAGSTSLNSLSIKITGLIPH